ncbi:translation initiation factor IF-2 [Treponema phagedenis]|uniref:Translation initiation factor IF-2 n=1 Tax=Treponema phagedenis TaxID=162 RepID=A0AAE6IRQ9_TREPH|nr:translation initiation factor IF-2 [Treponema phagedenis]NVP25270.1 translation initiation factor IF-2 [Treponema phagedenis]QEJ93979.1 translation initiation factor IF-2 [Treponema phagedenis]QEJ97053.1 translation initiation factor IF-2 [Treponema phagedenis]QEK02013.1 translation initiation factor IF-2 [Treponema phagedenis]QEK02963.1 translation initiation factor IF-2 [Treponema phagedenis]
MAEKNESLQPDVILKKNRTDVPSGELKTASAEEKPKKRLVRKKVLPKQKEEGVKVKKVVTVTATAKKSSEEKEESKKISQPEVVETVQSTAPVPSPEEKKQPKSSEKKKEEKPAPTEPEKKVVKTASSKEKAPSEGGQKKQKVPGLRVLDITAERPNRKAGNLAGQGGNAGTRKERYGGRQDNFTGAQARENAGMRTSYGRGKFAGKDGNRQNAGQGGARQGGGFGQRQNKQGFRPQGGFAGRPPAAPMPMETNKTSQGKKTFKGKKQIYQRKEEELDFFEEKLLQQKKKSKEKTSSVPKQIEIMESISVADLAKKMNLKASELIGKLMGMGMMVTMNQSIDSDTATILASEYNCDVKLVSLYDETLIESNDDEGGEMRSRPPIVTIMGHVDHGKTKTLDAIRRTHVSEGEFGGITQHIGAYTVSTPKGNITFLDTPGHEAFTMMRARGAEITDIVVLIVAADDGVMPQTIEALNHAKDAKVPIIVAINKIDKPEANPDKVMTRLSELGLMPEEWGGDTMYVKISALQRLGLDDLLDAILLQAEILELQANYSCRAEGKIIESQIDHGRGIVATVIVQRGILRTGDPYVAGIYSGRVRAIFNDRGEKIEEAIPSMPVEILGLEGMPNAGDPFQVTESEKIARQISSKRQELKRYEDSRNVKKVTLDNLYETIHDGEVLEFKVIIKGDVQGSVEALKQSLEKLSTKEIRLSVIHASAGAINDSDVMLAAADANAIIIGFNVRPTPQAKILAEQEKVDIRKYNVIYKAVEEIELAMEGLLRPDLKEEVIGLAEVRQVFKVPKIGNIAGSYILEGSVKRNSHVHVIREGIVLHSGKISSLRRIKDDVKEVSAGFECGIGIENYTDLKEGDQLEFIEVVEVARKLKDTEKYEPPKASTEE